MKQLFALFTILALATAQLCAQTAPKGTADYEKGIETLTDLGIKIGTSYSTAKGAMAGFVKNGSAPDFRTEYVKKYAENGLESISIYFGKENDQPCYEFILDFENADTLAATCLKTMGPSDHPRLADHWVVNVSDDGLTSTLMWTFEDKMVLAGNVPGTELASEDATFQLEQSFVDKFNGNPEGSADTEETPPAQMDGTPAPDDEAPNDQEFTNLLNLLFENAQTDFTAFRGDPVEGKKDTYKTILENEEQPDTYIRKSATGGWRLESKIGSYDNLENSKTAFDALKVAVQSLEALSYSLSKKSEYSTNTGNTYIWDVHSLDGEKLGLILKLQLYATSSGQYSIKMEVGK